MENLTKRRHLLGGIPVDAVAKTIVDDIMGLLNTESKAIVSYINPYVFIEAQKNKKLKRFLTKADIVYPDGWGIVFALRFLGKPIDERRTTADFFDQFCQEAARREVSIGFIGGVEEQGKRALETLKRKYPNLTLHWIYHGFFKEKQEEEIIKKINKKKIDILLVGLGTPRQELWVNNKLHQLNVRVIWPVGCLMDYYAGKPLAPRFLGKIHLEWLFRLATEPKRLWKRYTIGNIRFGYWLLKTKLPKKTARISK